MKEGELFLSNFALRRDSVVGCGDCATRIKTSLHRALFGLVCILRNQPRILRPRLVVYIGLCLNIPGFRCRVLAIIVLLLPVRVISPHGSHSPLLHTFVLLPVVSGWPRAIRRFISFFAEDTEKCLPSYGTPAFVADLLKTE